MQHPIHPGRWKRLCFHLLFVLPGEVTARLGRSLG